MSVWIVGLIAVGLVLYAVTLCNRLALRRNRVRDAWSQLDAALRRRRDLAIGLADAIARQPAVDPAAVNAIRVAAGPPVLDDIAARAAAEDAIEAALPPLIAPPETAAADGNVQSDPAAELRAANDRVTTACRHYNDMVEAYNTAIATFPNNLIVEVFGFLPEQLFAARDVKAAVPPPEGSGR